jgi:hypothetical protein
MTTPRYEPSAVTDRIAHRALSVWHPITHPLSEWNAAAQADKDRGRKRWKK